MRDILRSSTFDHVVRFITGDETLRYLEDSPDFDFHKYLSQPQIDIGNIGNLKRQSGEEEVESAHHTNGVPVKQLNSPNSTIIVAWYEDDDPENPQNWSDFKKYFVGLLIW